MLYYVAAIIYVLVCLVLVGVILLQQGKGGDLASAFGGGSSQAAFGARSGATVLTRATTVLAVLFLVGALMLNIMAQRGPGSVVGGRAPGAPTTTLPTPAQAAPTTAPTTAPAPATSQPATGASPATAPPAPGTAPQQ
jgi:preprotein translocase subunit SecG